MSTKFSQFAAVGNALEGDVIVGLRSGNNARFTFPATTDMSWTVVTSNHTLVANNGYFINSGALITLLAPVSFSIGDIFEIANIGSGGWIIDLNAGQKIRAGNVITSSGGTVSSSDIGDSIRLVAWSSTDLIVLSGVTVDFVIT